MACEMPEPCQFPSLDSCQRRFLWTHKKVDLTPHAVVGLVLQLGDTEKFPRALGFETLDPFFQTRQAGSMFHSRRGGDKRLVGLELACKADGVAPPDPV